MAVVSAAAVLFFFHQHSILYFGDAESHLNIARRIIDSRTPGYGQLGTVWLPLPHLLVLPFVASHENGVVSLAWAPDGKTLVSGGEDKTLRFWNVVTGHQIARITAHDGAVRAIVLP